MYGLPNMKAAAHQAFRWGLCPHPCCWPDASGNCGCGRGHQGRDIGKAPLLTGWPELVPTEELVEKWWTTWPTANIGCILKRAGLVVADLDGDEAVEEAKGYHLPPGPVSRSGRSEGLGEHRFFRLPAGCPVTNATRKGMCGKIDILANTNLILPPSLHRSGKRYEWLISPDDL
jgi:hypothetical protein